MDWLTLSLICAFSLATADAVGKKYLSAYSGYAILLVRFVVPGILLVPVLFFVPLPTELSYEFWLWLLAMVPLEIFAMLLYMQAIHEAPLYQTLPYLSFTPVFSMLTGWITLGETVSMQGALGIIFIVIGTYIINIDHSGARNKITWFAPFKAIASQRGSQKMLLAAFIYSFTAVGSKAAMQYAEPKSFGAIYFITIAIATFLLVLVHRPKALLILKQNMWPHLLVGSLMAIMVVTHFLAIALVEAAYMIAVKRLSLLFGVIYGAWWFHEKGIIKNFSAALLMLVGVAMILIA